jgi:iron(III) transport system substrate-binding protein
VTTPGATGAVQSDATLSAAIDAIYQKAKASGQTKVTHYGLEDSYRPVIESFQKRFQGITVEPVLLRGPEMIQRINAEAASGQYIANVASTGLTTMSELERTGRLVQWDPPNAANIPAPEGGSDHYRWMFTVGLFGILVNTDMVPEDKVPKSRQELLDPYWKGKGKLFSEDPRAAGPGQSFWVITHDDMGPDYLTKIKAQEITFTRERDAASQQIARGEYSIYFPSMLDSSILALQKAAPVKVYFFRDGGTFFTDTTAGVVKDAPGQDAAKLWISYLTSPEGQKELVDVVNVYPVIAGLPAPGGWPTYAELQPKSRTADQRSRTNDYVKTFEQLFFS